MRKKLALLLAAGMAISMLGCGQQEVVKKEAALSAEEKTTESQLPEEEKAADTEAVTLKYWSFYTGGEGEYVEQKVALWNEQNPDIQIEHTVVNQSDYTTTVIPTAYANGEAPDILYVEPATFKKYAEKNMLADLSSYYTDELKADILPSALEAVTLGGKVYALPMEMETLGLFYNADMLEEAGIDPPQTWDELYNAAKALTTKDVYGLVLPVEDSGYTLFNWWPFMWMNGADVYDKKGTLTVDTPEMAASLDYWGRFYKEGLSPSSLQIGPWDIGNVGTGIAAMQVGGTYMIGATEDTYKDVNIKVVPLPCPEGKNAITVAGGQKMAVNAQSENIDAAAKFIFWLYGDTENTDNASEWVTKAKFAYPARQSVIDANKEVFEKGLRADFTKFYNTAVPEPSYSAEVTDIIGDMTQNAMFGGMSGADAAAAAQKDIEALK